MRFPLESVAIWVMPRSIPTLSPVLGSASTCSSMQRVTKYCPARLVIVTVLGSLRNCLDQWTRRCPILARRRLFCFPSHVNAERVNSAACSPCFDLKRGKAVRFAKKLRKAICRCRRHCWRGTQETSFSQTQPTSFFHPVKAALV